MNRCALVGLGLSLCLFPRGASAAKPVEQSAGLKLFAGADGWSTPRNVAIAAQDGLGFSGSASGIGYGAMPFYELRIFKFFGAEAGINYEHGSIHRNSTLNRTNYRESMTLSSRRLPILAKLNIPLALGRLWLGLGPEFTIAQSSSSKAEQVPSGEGAASTSTREVKPTYLTGGLGLVVEIPLVGIEIPIELRGSKNMSQPDDFANRVKIERGGYMIRAESSWVIRLGAGIGFPW
jgi:hypothetical protein